MCVTGIRMGQEIVFMKYFLPILLFVFLLLPAKANAVTFPPCFPFCNVATPVLPISKPVQVATPTPTKAPIVPPTTAPTTNELSSMMSEVNAYRAKNGLSSVTTDSKSCAYATQRSKEIVSDFSHNGFNSTRLAQAYGRYSSAFENIASGYTYRTVINAWINSAGHAANMRSNVTYVCIGWTGSAFVMEGYRP
jgi:uncharacterized protein YkwD